VIKWGGYIIYKIIILGYRAWKHLYKKSSTFEQFTVLPYTALRNLARQLTAVL